MNQKVSYKTIIVIIIASSCIGLVHNFFNSKGIPLIAKEKKIEWVNDSLIQNNIDSSSLSALNNPAQLKKEDKNSELSKKEIVLKPTPSKPTYINLKQAYKLFLSKKVLFIDARDKWEFADGHISGSINIPEYNFDKNNQNLLNIPKNKTLITYCDGDDCEMSSKLAENLFNIGYKNIFIFFGGWKEWINAGYRIEKTNG